MNISSIEIVKIDLTLYLYYKCHHLPTSKVINIFSTLTNVVVWRWSNVFAEKVALFLTNALINLSTSLKHLSFCEAILISTTVFFKGYEPDEYCSESHFFVHRSSRANQKSLDPALHHGNNEEWRIGRGHIGRLGYTEVGYELPKLHVDKQQQK